MLAGVIQIRGAEDQFTRRTAGIVYPLRLGPVRLRSLGPIYARANLRTASHGRNQGLQSLIFSIWRGARAKLRKKFMRFPDQPFV
jgi:hypothetical protein